jgi:hypothetical protein
VPDLGNTNAVDTSPFELADATWPEADVHARRALVVPLGSIEQHGPHLPDEHGLAWVPAHA